MGVGSCIKVGTMLQRPNTENMAIWSWLCYMINRVLWQFICDFCMKTDKCLTFFLTVTYICNELSISIISHISKCFVTIWKKGTRSDSDGWQKPLHPPKIQKATWQHKNVTKNFDYTTIADRRSVGVTTATQLMWYNRFTGSQPSHWPQKLCSQKDAHLKNYK